MAYLLQEAKVITIYVKSKFCLLLSVYQILVHRADIIFCLFSNAIYLMVRHWNNHLNNVLASVPLALLLLYAASDKELV